MKREVLSEADRAVFKGFAAIAAVLGGVMVYMTPSIPADDAVSSVTRFDAEVVSWSYGRASKRGPASIHVSVRTQDGKIAIVRKETLPAPRAGDKAMVRRVDYRSGKIEHFWVQQTAFAQ